MLMQIFIDDEKYQQYPTGLPGGDYRIVLNTIEYMGTATGVIVLKSSVLVSPAGNTRNLTFIGQMEGTSNAITQISTHREYRLGLDNFIDFEVVDRNGSLWTDLNAIILTFDVELLH